MNIVTLLSVHCIVYMHSCSVSGRHDSGISLELMEPRNSISSQRRPSASASMLRSVLPQTGQNSSTSGSDLETGSIQRTPSTDPESMSISPEAYNSENEDVFDGKAFGFSKQQTTIKVILSSPKKHPPLRPGTSLTLMPGSEKRNRYPKNGRIKSVSLNADQRDHFPASDVKPVQLPIVSNAGKSFIRENYSLDRRRNAFKKTRLSTLDLNIQKVLYIVTWHN